MESIVKKILWVNKISTLTNITTKHNGMMNKVKGKVKSEHIKEKSKRKLKRRKIKFLIMINF